MFSRSLSKPYPSRGDSAYGKIEMTVKNSTENEFALKYRVSAEDAEC